MKHEESSLMRTALRVHLPLTLLAMTFVIGLVLALDGFPTKPPPPWPWPCQPAEGEKTVLEFDGTCHVIKLGVGQLPQKR